MKEFVQKHGLTASALKWIAMITMVINHVCFALYYNVGLDNYFLSDVHWYISRLAFVIFAFQIAEGMFYTKNRAKYIFFIFLFALISEIPYNLLVAFKPFDIGHQCVLWSLGLGCLAIVAIDKLGKKPLVIIAATVIACAIGCLMNVEYWGCGITMIVLLYIFRDCKWKALLFGAIAFVLGAIFEFAISYLKAGYDLATILKANGFWHTVFEEWHGLVAFPLFMLYNGKKGKNINKWFFYIFYPGHLVIIYLITLLINAIK